jgi:sec-independent protein translocase protein TatA
MIGGLGVQELLIVFVIAMVLFGGKRLPEIGQSLGKALRGFKDTSEVEPEQVVRENTADSTESEEAAAPPAPTEENTEESADKAE